jgi:hypothetical protein
MRVLSALSNYQAEALFLRRERGELFVKQCCRGGSVFTDRGATRNILETLPAR